MLVSVPRSARGAPTRAGAFGIRLDDVADGRRGALQKAASLSNASARVAVGSRACRRFCGGFNRATSPVPRETLPASERRPSSLSPGFPLRNQRARRRIQSSRVAPPCTVELHAESCYASLNLCFVEP